MIACMASVAMAGCADEESFSSSRSHLLAFSADTVSLGYYVLECAYTYSKLLGV